MSGSAVDAALATALPTAATREHATLVERLLERQAVAGRLALVKNLHRLEPRAAARVCEAADHGLDAAVRRAFGSGTDATRNALRLIGQRQLGHLAYLVVDATSLPRRDLADEAAAVLTRLAAEAAPGTTQAANLAAAVDPAVSTWGLRGSETGCHEGLLDAFLLLALEKLPSAREALAGPDHPALPPLARRLSRAAGAAERGALLPLLAVETLREAALEGLAVAARGRAFRGVFPDLTVLADPAIARALGSVERPSRLCPAAWPAEADVRERCGWLHLVTLLPVADETRGRWFALALADPDPGVRALALSSAARLRGPRAVCRPLSEAAAHLAETAGAQNSFEARLAARVAVAAAGGRRAATLSALAASPTVGARAVAERALASEAAEDLLRRWELASANERADLLRTCLLQPGGEGTLRSRLSPRNAGDIATRRRLQTVRTALGQFRAPAVTPASPAAAAAEPIVASPSDAPSDSNAPAAGATEAALATLETLLDRAGEASPAEGPRSSPPAERRAFP